MSPTELFQTFLISLLVILGTCLLFGRISKYVGQPAVVGEMIAGVCLGPSLLGRVAPDAQEWIFPDGAPMTLLFVLSQFGLVMFMFVVGLEFNAALIRRQARRAAAVSLAGIVVPLLLGAALSVVLLSQTGVFFTEGTAAPTAALFTGAAIATTAFPMLARIVTERGISGTPLGTLVLGAGAADDAAAWILLAVVVAVVSGAPATILLAVGGGLAYLIVATTIGRRLLGSLSGSADAAGEPISPRTLGVVLLCIAAAALYTDTVGIHSIFGGFLLGAVMPRENGFSDRLRHTLEPVVKVLLLPLFFVYSGLNTEIGLVNTPLLWTLALLALVVSIAGKGLACFAAAKATGSSTRDALAIGSLMNSRGLMELILLNVGLQAAVISPTMFTVFVLMAIVTTVMATPLFNLAYRPRPGALRAVPAPDDTGHREHSDRGSHLEASSSTLTEPAAATTGGRIVALPTAAVLPATADTSRVPSPTDAAALDRPGAGPLNTLGETS